MALDTHPHPYNDKENIPANTVFPQTENNLSTNHAASIKATDTPLSGAIDNNNNNNSNMDDDYDEDQDDDYVLEPTTKSTLDGTSSPSNSLKSANHDDDDEEDADDAEFIDEEDKKELAKYSSIESSEGGLIKTRRQRLEEEEKLKNEKKNHVRNTNSSSSNVDINSIWAELNGATKKNHSHSNQPLSTTQPSNFSKPSTKEEKIKITRTYEFAGKMISEEKWVDANSEEARAHLNSTTIKNPTSKLSSSSPSSSSSNSSPQPSNSKPLRRKRKRASLLDAVISNSSKTKLSTLEKSRLDWATYVDKNKISDELKYKNKGGYLEKQDFLNRVDSRRDNLYTEAKSKISKEN